MKTITNSVENYINNKPYLLTSLSRGIINLTSLAREMQAELKQDLGKEVKIGAIVMSLKRLTEEISFKMNLKMEEVLKNLGEITVRSSLSEFTFIISKSIYENQVKVLKELENSDSFFTSSRGVNELNIVVSTAHKDKVIKHFANEKQILTQDYLASITIKLPEENTKTSGLYYFFFQKLAWEKVVVKEVISTTNEFTLIVSENDVELAFRVINSLKIK
jgi:hypothetical protein